MTKLSIIIPTFNSADRIERCLESIRVQTFGDYEVVIQDGGSQDGTVELIEKFAHGHPGLRLALEQKQDKGPYDAMNKGMGRSKGEWLYFLGSDDELYDENVLDKFWRSAETVEGEVLYGNVQVVGKTTWAEDGAFYDGPFDLTKLLNANISHQAMFYRAKFAREVGSFNVRYKIVADWDYNMRCWAKGRFKYVDLVVAKFSAGGISSVGRRDRPFEAEVTQNVLRYFNLSANDPLVNSPSFCGRQFDEARRATRITPRRVLRALARRLGSAH